jgi:hypothetical protein
VRAARLPSYANRNCVRVVLLLGAALSKAKSFYFISASRAA